MNSKNALVEGLLWALENRPDDFGATEHRLIDRKAGQDWWVANGWLGLSLYQPFKMSIGFWNKLRVWNAIRYWQARHLAKTNYPLVKVEQ